MCPTQVPPEMPRRALQDGTTGVVKAQITLKNGTVQDVTILTGPRVFHAAVKAAIMQYKCVSDNSGVEAVATQEFNFKID
jgi:protein TonB